MFSDNRGKLYFPIKNNNFISKECTVSVNNINVFRGIHIEQFNKLVTCIEGKILDIVINFNESDEDYLIPKYYTLDANTINNQIFVKSNHGHGFLSLTQPSIIIYNFDDIFDNNKTKTINYLDPCLNIKLPINNVIISEKDLTAKFIKPIDYIIFGGNGFIGQTIINHLKITNKSYIKSSIRLEDTHNIEKELDLYKPKFVINSAGITGVPNISWCETNKIQTIETNIIYQLTLAKLCNDRSIHLTVIGSGAIFKGDRYYTENDEGNFNDNFYSKCRNYLENIIKNYNNVFYIRINYPIGSIQSPKNLITKLLNYKKIENKNLSISYIDELIPYMVDMIENKETGICNLVNKGTINLVDIINKYNIISNIKHEFEIINNTSNTNKSESLLLIGKL